MELPRGYSSLLYQVSQKTCLQDTMRYREIPSVHVDHPVASLASSFYAS